MSRMKTFFIYAVIIAIFYVFSNILIYLFINGTYKDITGTLVSDNVEVTQAKSTYVNGYIDGKVTNKTENEIMNQYVKLDIYSKRGVCLGTKYAEVKNLKPNESMDFHIGYKFKDSYRYEISMVDDVSEATDEQFISDEMAWYLVAGVLIITLFI